MIRALTLTITALSICAFSVLPVFAEDNSASSSPELKTETADKKLIADGDAKADPASPKSSKKKKDPSAKKSGGSVNPAARLASFTTGVVFGTPIAMVRRTGIEIVQGERDLVGDADSWVKKVAYVFPGFISVPYGSISGGIGGVVYGVKNAWSGSGHEPFGKDSFSLGDIGN